MGMPKGWPGRVLAAVLASLAGNLVIRLIPWPQWLLSSYSCSMAQARDMGTELIPLTLFAAPLAEEGLFRWGIFGVLRRYMSFWSSAVLSSAAFGVYHGNWIQGSYAFVLGMVLAWGYEGSEDHKYIMAAVMHGAANLAALVVFQ